MNAPSRERTPGTLYVVAAPSGAGKTSLVNRLVECHPGLLLSVSYTTRPARPGEVDGEHYHFISDAEFDRMAADGAFLEHAEVFGHRYGTGRDSVRDALHAGRDVILEIDWQGARQVRSAMSDAVGVFILPPSREALVRRLRGRGQDSQAVIDARMAEADEELSHYQEFDYLVINDDFDTALADLEAIMRSRRLARESQRRRHAALIASLLDGDG